MPPPRLSMQEATIQRFSPITISTSDVNAPAANTAAVITYAAETQARHVLYAVQWSYSAAPTGGNLKIEDGSGTTVFTIDITAGGPGFISFDPPRRGTATTAMIITLAAGGGGISGKVNATHALEQGGI